MRYPLIPIALLALPALIFAAFRHRLRGRRQAWLLLGVVLLLFVIELDVRRRQRPQSRQEEGSAGAPGRA